MVEFAIGSVLIGGNRPVVAIAGLCVIQDEEHTLMVANRLKEITDELAMPFIFKVSYDKANRTSIKSYRGPGLKEGLRIIERVKAKLGVMVLTDVHRHEEISAVAEVADILQIPAFLCRQTDFVVQVAKAGKPVNIKKGQFLAPWDIKNVIEKVLTAGHNKIMLTERGTCFGYNNLVSDMRSLVIMKEFGYPVIYDATHSVQLPGGAGTASGGQRQFVSYLARAAAAVGINGLFLETHEDPDRALSDGPNTVSLDEMPSLLCQIRDIDNYVKKAEEGGV